MKRLVSRELSLDASCTCSFKIYMAVFPRQTSFRQKSITYYYCSNDSRPITGDDCIILLQFLRENIPLFLSFVLVYIYILIESVWFHFFVIGDSVLMLCCCDFLDNNSNNNVLDIFFTQVVCFLSGTETNREGKETFTKTWSNFFLSFAKHLSDES
jgi:hypothetical protein